MKKKQYLKPQNTLYSFTTESFLAQSNTNTGGSGAGGNMPGGNEGADEEENRVKPNIWNEW
jgi:hypothetical protein